MSEKDEYIIKLSEQNKLVTMMDFYNVINLQQLSLEQVKSYWEVINNE